MEGLREDWFGTFGELRESYTQNKKIAKSFVEQVKSGTTDDGSMVHHSLTMRQAEVVPVITKQKTMSKGLCCSIL